MLFEVHDDNFINEKITPKMNIPFLVHIATFNNFLFEDTFGEDIKNFLYLKRPIIYTRNI